jgi:hypothetical protein
MFYQRVSVISLAPWGPCISPRGRCCKPWNHVVTAPTPRALGLKSGARTLIWIFQAYGLPLILAYLMCIYICNYIYIIALYNCIVIFIPIDDYYRYIWINLYVQIFICKYQILRCRWRERERAIQKSRGGSQVPVAKVLMWSLRFTFRGALQASPRWLALRLELLRGESCTFWHPHFGWIPWQYLTCFTCIY